MYHADMIDFKETGDSIRRENSKRAKDHRGPGWSRRQFVQAFAVAGALLPHVTLGKDKTMNRRPLCIFSKHLQWCASYEEMAEVAAVAGFDGVDLAVRKGGHVEPEAVAERLPEAVRAVRAAGLDVYMVTTGIIDPEEAHTLSFLKTAGELGIGFYRFGMFSYDDPHDIQSSMQRLKPRLKTFEKLNAKHRIHGAIQNHAGTRVGGPVWDLGILLDGLDAAWMGCQYDVRHATVEGGTAWPLGLALLKDRIRITAIKDFRWVEREGRWSLQNVPLGEGMVDFRRYFQLVKRYELEGPISLHFEYDLGGVEHGRGLGSVDRDKIIASMSRDVKTLRDFLEEAGVSP